MGNSFVFPKYWTKSAPFAKYSPDFAGLNCLASRQEKGKDSTLFHFFQKQQQNKEHASSPKSGLLINKGNPIKST